MIRFATSRRLPHSVSVIALATAFASPAYAQVVSEQAPVATEVAQAAEQEDPLANTGDAATLPAADTAAEEEGAIVVTGSRLRRDERSSSDPLTVIDPNVENREGRFTTAEILQSSPLAAGSVQITGALATGFLTNGGEGTETISLRGLGDNRTLLLINGRRVGPAGTRGAVGPVDLGVIPPDAIRTVDILKTGASSIYGSDAVAGVVNLITKKDLDGLQMRAFASATHKGGGEELSLSATYGFDVGDRGHIMIGADWYNRKSLRQGQRAKILGCQEEYLFNNDGERVDTIDPRTGKITCGLSTVNTIALLDLSPSFGGGSNLIRNGRPITNIQFNYPGDRLDEFLDPLVAPDENHPLHLGVPDGFFPVGSYSRDGLALLNRWDRRYDTDDVIPKTTRYNLYTEGAYDVSDNVNLYFEGQHHRRKTKTNAHRAFGVNQFTGDSIIPAYGVGLPYIYCSRDGFGLGDNDCDPFAAGDPLNQGFTGTQIMGPGMIAPFDSSADLKYYRGVAGVHAELSNILPEGFADFYFQHSRSDGDYARDIIIRDAIDFGVADFRTDLCAGTVTAIRGVPCMDIDYTDLRVLRGDFTPEERAFLFGVDKGHTIYKQNVAELSFGGELFNLPAGPLQAVMGGHWRRDEIRDTPGEFTLTDNVYQSYTTGITAGHMNTLEAFGEVGVPLLRDLPMVHDLSLNAAGRVTSTKAVRADGASDSDKGNWTYKLSGNYMPTDWLRFRSTYGTSFRSPALFEQFLANQSGFINQSNDPCSNLSQSSETSPELVANCAAHGVPTDYVGVGFFEVFTGGGVGVLDPETSKALTLGFVFTPKGWLWSGGQFSFTADYVDINIKDEISQLGANNIMQGCYTSDDFPNDPLCDLFTRDTSGPNPSYNIMEVRDPYINVNKQRNKSIDFISRFSQDLGNKGMLSMIGQLTYQLTDKITLFQGITSDNNGMVGDPKWIGDLNVSWYKDPFTVTYGLQVIAKTSNLEDQLEVFGGAMDENNCVISATAQALYFGDYCPTYKLPRVAYHSLSAEIQAGKNFSFLFGVSNLFDKQPPRVSTRGTVIAKLGSVPAFGTYYDYYGRKFFVSVRAKLNEKLGLE